MKTGPSFVVPKPAANPLRSVNVADGYAVPTIADVTGDGLADVLVGSGSGTLEFWHNTGTNTSAKFTKRNGPSNPFGSLGLEGPPVVSDLLPVQKCGMCLVPRLVDIDDDGDQHQRHHPEETCFCTVIGHRSFPLQTVRRPLRDPMRLTSGSHHSAGGENP